MKIALDAMGGDFGPPNLVGGAVMALREYPHIDKLFLVGDTAQIEAELKKHDCNDRRIEIVHSTQVVEMSDGAVEAVRRKKDSSVSRAVDLVKKGEADAIVSAGHTGAAVAATTIKLRTLPGIDRPGIAAVIPSETNIFVLIDAGANSDARAEHLLQYAIMGSVYSRHVLGYKNPAIGLMSIGGEDVKGTDLTKEVFKMLKRSALNFRGNIEGHDLFADPGRGRGLRRLRRQRHSENLRIGRRRDFQMAQARADEKQDADGRRLPRAERLSQRSRKKVNYEEYGGIAAARRERHLHHRARREHAARDQERAARRGRVD